MTYHGDVDDVRAIESLIAGQFESVSWDTGHTMDGPAFDADYFPGAPLYPAARPAKPSTVNDFIARMNRLSQSELRSFKTTFKGAEIHAFGNVAVAFAVCEMVENETETVRGIEAFLLIKDDGTWRIGAQTWDTESAAGPIPAYLLSGGAG